MPLSVSKTVPGRRSAATLSPEHLIRLILHRKWLVIATFLVISGLTAVIAYRMPDVYTSETVIMVDPQKVPESYVKPTVTGDVRNRLGTLSQQILSATRLQKIIDQFNLYPVERNTMAREDVIALMRKDITVSMVGNSGPNQEVQAFKIGYSGRDPRLVANVANKIASLFIDENLKARADQAEGTTDFLENQLKETKAALETQEAKLRDFKLKHVGEMPEQQQATLQILGQLQSQLQIESDALARAEQQKSYLQSMTSQVAPVVDLDQDQPQAANRSAAAKTPAGKRSHLEVMKSQLAALMAQGYTDLHPDVRRLKSDIAKQEALEAVQGKGPGPAPDRVTSEPVKTVAVATTSTASNNANPKAAPAGYLNPVIQSQLNSVDTEIGKHKQEIGRLNKEISSYQGKLEAIPVREQEIADLVRDYEISKAHYKQLLENQLSAETATQLEIRQKGETFSVLDPAQPAERPSRPNRMLIDIGGSLGGLVLGLMLAIVTELFETSISAPEHLADMNGIPMLEVIPIIETQIERRLRKRRLILASASGVLLSAVVSGAFLLRHFGS